LTRTKILVYYETLYKKTLAKFEGPPHSSKSPLKITIKWTKVLEKHQVDTNWPNWPKTLNEPKGKIKH